jgi:integrase/recombinase XerD
METLKTIDKNLTTIQTTDITEDLYIRFIDYLDVSKKTIETYARALKQFFKFLSVNNINRPDRKDVIYFKDQIKATHKPTTVQNYIVAVRLFFSWAEQEGLYKNIANKIKGSKLNREHKKDYLTSNQVKAVLSGIDRSTLKGLRDYAILSLMITGGLRTIEVSRANVEDIRAVGDSTVLYIQGKGREEKTDYIKIQPIVERAIRSYLKSDSRKLNPKEPLFSSTSNNSKGKRLSTRSISGMVKNRLVKTGYDSERLTAHSLRHTAVTLTLLGGQTLQEVQQFARHTNITTTQIYAHNLDRAKNKCEEVIARAIF